MRVPHLRGKLLGVVLACLLIGGSSGCATPQSAPTQPQAMQSCPETASLLNATDSAYGLELVKLIGRRAFYPEIAQIANQSGVVNLCVELGRNGSIKSALVNDTSGYLLLDGAALYSVGRARATDAMSKVPEELGGASDRVWFSVPVAFHLQGQSDPAAPVADLDEGPKLNCSSAAVNGPWSQTPEASDYFQEAQTKFQEQLVYPSEAVRQWEEGKVSVCMNIKRDGNIGKAVIWHSSGDPLFDGIALMTVGMVTVQGGIGPFPDTVPGNVTYYEVLIPITWRISTRH